MAQAWPLTALQVQSVYISLNDVPSAHVGQILFIRVKRKPPMTEKGRINTNRADTGYILWEKQGKVDKWKNIQKIWIPDRKQHPPKKDRQNRLGEADKKGIRLLSGSDTTLLLQMEMLMRFKWVLLFLLLMATEEKDGCRSHTQHSSRMNLHNTLIFERERDDVER